MRASNYRKKQPSTGSDHGTLVLVPATDRIPMLKGMPREIVVLAGIAFCVALGYGILAPALPVFARIFGVSAFLASAVISFFAVMRLVGSPLAGALINKIGERIVLASGLIIVAVSSLVAGLSQNYSQLLILRGVGGVGSAMFTVSAMALMLRTAPPDLRGRAAGVFHAGFLLGGIAGPAVGGIVVGWSIRAPFFIYAATLAAATAVTLFYLRKPSEFEVSQEAEGLGKSVVVDSGLIAGEPGDQLGVKQPDIVNHESTNDPSDSEQTGSDDKSGSFWYSLRNHAYRSVLMANFTNGFVTFGIRMSLVPLFVVESLHRGPGLAGAGFLVGAITQGALLWSAGKLADVRGRRLAIVIGCAFTAVGMLMIALSVESILFLVGMGLVGVGTAFLGSAPAAVVGDLTAGKSSGSAIAGFQMISDFGAIIGPLLAGIMVDYVGYHWALGSGAVVALFALLLAIGMPETKPSSTEKSTL